VLVECKKPANEVIRNSFEATKQKSQNHFANLVFSFCLSVCLFVAVAAATTSTATPPNCDLKHSFGDSL
jgi:hypothetical protein